MQAQKAVSLLKQVNMSSMGIFHGNYSGITHIEGDTFAIISDKPCKEGKTFKLIRIEQSPKTGEIVKIERVHEPALDLQNTLHYRDCEDIIYDKATKTFHICGEADQAVIEYYKDISPTGRKFDIPSHCSINHIYNNKGFEALGHSAYQDFFWTTTESHLREDCNKTDDKIRVRLLCFNKDLSLKAEHIYETEQPIYKYRKSKEYAFGIPAITSLDDGRLIVMEREMHITKNYLGSTTSLRLFVINPQNKKDTIPCHNVWSDTCKPLDKEELCSFKTHLKIGKMNLANYEGMCLGRKLSDGRQTLLLISDSQNGKGNIFYRLKDYIKVLIMDN
jgi:hypothetical protein